MPTIVVWLADSMGLPLGLPDFITIVIVATLASMGASPAPGLTPYVSALLSPLFSALGFLSLISLFSKLSRFLALFACTSVFALSFYFVGYSVLSSSLARAASPLVSSVYVCNMVLSVFY